MATEELIIQARWHDRGFSAGAKQAQRDLDTVSRNARVLNTTLGALGSTASQVKDASDAAAFSLGLVVEQLRHVEPAAESTLDGIRQMVFGIQNLDAVQAAGLSAAAAALGGIAGTIVGFIGSVVGSFIGERIEENLRSFDFDFDPTRAIRDILDPSELFDMDLAEIFEELGDFWDDLHLEDLKNLARYEQLTLRERRALSQAVTRFEIALLEDKTAIIIAAIARERDVILREIDDAEQAQRAALKRAIGLQFDVAEAELRARYQPLFAGAGGDRAQLALVRESAERDIEVLRRDEANALTHDLQDLSDQFDEERLLVHSFFGGVIAALNKISEDLSNSLDDSQGADPITYSGTVDVNVDVPEITMSEDAKRVLDETLGPNSVLAAVYANGIAVKGLLDENGNPITIKVNPLVLPDPFPKIEFAGITNPDTDEDYQIRFAGITNLDTNEDYQIRFAGILDENGNPFAIGPSQALIDLINEGIEGEIAVILKNIELTFPDTLLANIQAIRDNTASLSGFNPYSTHAKDIVKTLTTLPNWHPILEAIQDNTAVLKSGDIQGQAKHNRSVRLLLRSINHQLGGSGIEALVEIYRGANDGTHKDEEKYAFAGDPPIEFPDGQKVTTSTNLFGHKPFQKAAMPTGLFEYKTFQTDIEKIRDQITSADKTLGSLLWAQALTGFHASFTAANTSNMQQTLESMVTELKNLEKPSYTIGDIHIHAEKIDEESAEEIVTEIRDRIITEFGENTELRNVRYAYAGADVLT